MAEKTDKHIKQQADESKNELVEKLEKDLEESQRLQEESLVKAQRALADYANLKKRFEKEREEIAKYASEMLFMRLLPVIDNLDRAVGYANQEEQKSSLYMGVKMTLQQAHEMLQSIGFSHIQAKAGEEFNPHLHEAVEMVAGEQAKIVEILQPGYKLDEKVIRPAQVKVGNGEVVT